MNPMILAIAVMAVTILGFIFNRSRWSPSALLSRWSMLLRA